MGFRGEYGRFNIEVTVKKGELIERMKKNREKHKIEYDQAIRLWQEAFEEAVKNIDYKSLQQFPSILDNLQDDCPVSFLDEYDDIIDMFEMGINDEILLTSDAFKKFCRDEWDWKSDIAQNKYYKIVINPNK